MKADSVMRLSRVLSSDVPDIGFGILIVKIQNGEPVSVHAHKTIEKAHKFVIKSN